MAANVAFLVWNRFSWLVALDLLYLSLFLSMACIYLARTYKDVVQRPITVVDWAKSSVNWKP